MNFPTIRQSDPSRFHPGGGQTQNRTGDTRIFSPLLYRLSYLAPQDKRRIKSGPRWSVNLNLWGDRKGFGHPVHSRAKLSAWIKESPLLTSKVSKKVLFQAPLGPARIMRTGFIRNPSRDSFVGRGLAIFCCTWFGIFADYRPGTLTALLGSDFRDQTVDVRFVSPNTRVLLRGV